MALNIVCHVGLHKTATSYLQSCVFPRWQGDRLFYNPAPLHGLLKQVMMLEIEKQHYPLVYEECQRDFIEALRDFQDCYREGTLFFSYEKISQFDYVQNYRANAELLYRLMPQAKIILVLRWQLDWLLSVYKEAVSIGDYQSPFEFFNFDGRFHGCTVPWGEDFLLKMDARKADWCELLSIYRGLFGEQRVKVYFFEDFRQNSEQVIAGFADEVGLVSLPIPAQEGVVNPSLNLDECAALSELSMRFQRLGISWLMHTTRREHRRRMQRVLHRGNSLRYLFSTRPKFLTHNHGWMMRHLPEVNGGAFRSQQAKLVEELTPYYLDLNQCLTEMLPGVKIPARYLRAQE